MAIKEIVGSDELRVRKAREKADFALKACKCEIVPIIRLSPGRVDAEYKINGKQPEKCQQMIQFGLDELDCEMYPVIVLEGGSYISAMAFKAKPREAKVING